MKNLEVETSSNGKPLDLSSLIPDGEEITEITYNGEKLITLSSAVQMIVKNQHMHVNWFKWVVGAGCVAGLIVVSLVLDHLRHLPDKVANGALGVSISDLASKAVREETAGHGHRPIYTTGQLVSWKESGNLDKETHGRRGTVIYFKVCQGDPDHRYLYKIRMWPIPKQDKPSALVWVKEGYLYAGADAATTYVGEDDLVQE